MKKKENNKMLLFVELIILLLGIGYFITSIFLINDNKFFHLINSFLLTTAIILYIIDNLDKDKLLYKILFVIVLGITILFNIFDNSNILAKKEILVGNLSYMSINDVLDWGKENNIIIEQSYEYSDNVKEFDIISQNITYETPLKDVSTIRVVVSLGPNYDKLVIIPNLVGMTIEDVINKKNELLLNNVIINYELNKDFTKDTVISQSIKGQYKRNNEITFTMSLGSEILPTVMIDLKNKSLFDATLWLKQNGIKYKLNYEFSDVTRDYVISHDIQEGKTINNGDSVNLVVSKGKSIKVPNLLSMTSEEVIKWISDNKLKIEFSDKYDVKVPLGTIIEANYKENDEIEVGTLIKIVTSKGQLKMPSFASLTDFRSWASTYGIKYNEEYQMNDSVPKGNIIKFSIDKDQIINLETSITVYISNGKAVIVPNFYGKNKNEITNTCNNIGLRCSFYDYEYTDKAKDIAIVQNFKAGSTTISGSSVSIGVSKGIAQTFTLKINQSSIQDCLNVNGCTINYLKQLFTTNYPGVGVKYVEKASNTFQGILGNIHEDSPIKDGSSITQGKSYEIWITK